MKKLVIILSATLLFSCADSKRFEIDGKTVIAEPYGIVSEDDERIDGVIYEVSTGNVICSIIFCETVFIPVWLVGWDLYEPIKLKEEVKK